jgi:hypothetical protein
MKIKLICRTCKKEYSVPRVEIPNNIDRIECNWCVECEHMAQDCYEEFWIRSRRVKKKKDKQLKIEL